MFSSGGNDRVIFSLDFSEGEKACRECAGEERGGKGRMAREKRKIDKEMNIGEILEMYPRSREVFQKHFGKNCVNCAASRMESIFFGALMHNRDANAIVNELNAMIKT
jgi:hybrid cluster-associated redox disulfide protein